MNSIYIGDRVLDPEDVVYCPHCEQEFYLLAELKDHIDQCLEDGMPDMTDPGEPNEQPE